MLDLPKGFLKWLFIQRVTHAALRGGLGRVGDRNDLLCCINITSQQKVATIEEQAERFGVHCSVGTLCINTNHNK